MEGEIDQDEEKEKTDPPRETGDNPGDGWLASHQGVELPSHCG